MLALLLLAALRVPAGDRAGAVVVLGMAGLAMGCISPKAWVHHYVAGTAALYALPVAAWRRGRTTAAYVFATVPWALCAIHFATEGFGGVLGLGLAAYVIAGLVWLLRAYRAGSSATSACCGDSVVS
ncbi:MAG: hypothetical protein HYU66_09640 [Armatimonadetes bacterium]|nr:hypothetical protein [Armatimonadota bacterium]